MDTLFATYPELEAEIIRLCAGVPWCITGASALLYDEQAYYFEITKPKHWQPQPDGTLLAGIGGIGGSLEPGESVLDCLTREVEEELHARIALEAAEATFLVYEQRVAERVAPQHKDYPLPVLCTISRNLYRQAHYPGCGILAIVTFLARLCEAPAPADLFGLLTVPPDQLPALFLPERIAVQTVARLPGVRLLTAAPLPDYLVFAPVWTGRSLQLLIQGGHFMP